MFVANLIRRATGRPRNPKPKQRPIAENVAVITYADAAPFLFWAEEKTAIRFHVSPEKLVMHGAFPFGGGWNPFVSALLEGRQALGDFYARFQPRNLGDMYSIEEGGRGSELPPWEPPWIMRHGRPSPAAEGGLSLEHGVSFYGPVSLQKLDYEMSRLVSLREAIARHGYQPDQYGDIAGYSMRRGDDFRFFVRGGKHRAAVLCGLGVETVPVQFRSAWPRQIDIADSRYWPLVASGALGLELAERIFHRYFDSEGSDQNAELTRR